MATTVSETQVQELYIAYFGRPADPTGLAFYADALDAATTTINDIAASFAVSTEAATTVALGTDAYLAAVYLQAFGRAYVEGTDGTFWKDAINNAETTKELAMVQILNGASGTDATAVTNKVTVAKTYTAAVTADSKDYSGDTAAAAAKVVLDGVTDDAATVTSGNTAAQTAVDGLSNASAGVGETFALTAGADTIFGTAMDDTFNATSTTYESTDTIADATTSDNDTLQIEATDDVAATATVVGIENVNFNLTATTTTTNTASNFDVALDNVAAGNITVSNSSTSSPVTGASVTGVATGNTLNFSDHFDTVVVDADDNAAVTIRVGTTTAANTNLTIQDATGTVDAATVVASGALTLTSSTNDGALTLTSAGNMVATAAAATTVTATSGGTASLTTAAATSITATAVGQLTLADGDLATTLSLTSLDDVDITTADAATSATISAGTVTAAAVSTITGATALTSLNVSGNGSAAVFNTTGAAALASVAVSGDQDVTIQMNASDIDAFTAGTGDVITVTDTSTAGTTTLSLLDGGNVNATAAAVDIIRLAADNVGNTLTTATGATVQIDADQTATSTMTQAVAGAATNALTLNIDDSTAGVTATATNTLTVSNVATINAALTDSWTATASNFGTAAVTVTGTGTAALILAGATTAGSVDASSLSTVVTANLAGGTTLSTLTTGSGDDLITTATAASTGGYTLSTGSGADTVTVTTTAQALGDMTWDGGSGVDTLVFAAANSDIDANIYSLTSVEVLDIDTALTVDASFIDGKTYLIKENDNNGVITVAAMDQATVDLSGLSFEESVGGAMTTVINGSAIGAFQNLTITGSSKVDAITGGAGDDTIVAGGTGGDSFITGGGTDTYTGGAGVDAITANAAGTLTLTGGLTGTDTIDSTANVALTTTVTDATDITYSGGTAVDTFTSGGGAIAFTGGAGADVYTGGAGVDTIILDGAADSTISTDITNTVNSFSSNDIIDLTGVSSFKHGGAETTAYGTEGALGNIADLVGFQTFSTNITVASAATGPTEAEMETYFAANEVFFVGNTDDSVYVAADDGVNTYIMQLASSGANKVFTAAEDEGVVLAILTGMTDATTLSAANLADFT